MPSSDYSSVEHRLASRSPHLTGGGGPPEKDQQLRCPRCDSINTKFCYYNNYNLSQPRHFCKDCRRYWTQGGTLRDVPVGGGTRKHSTKRFRKPSSTSSSSSLPSIPEPIFANPISSRPITTSVSSTISDHHHHHHHFNGVGGSFASLLNPQPSPTLLAFNGFGFDDMVTFETGKGVVWPLGFGENTHSGGIGLIGGGIGNTWQLGISGGASATGGDASGGDGDFYTWPELGMSTPRKGVK